MRDAIKMSGILVLGLFVAIIGYPFLHEAGHSIAAICFGAEISEFNIFPIPYIICNVAELNLYSQTLIGVSGMLFPLCVTVFAHNNFWAWYTALVLKGICLLSFILAGIALICFEFGFVWTNEDIIQVLFLWNGRLDLCVIMLVSFFVGVILIMFSILHGHPIRRIISFFDI